MINLEKNKYDHKMFYIFFLIHLLFNSFFTLSRYWYRFIYAFLSLESGSASSIWIQKVSHNANPDLKHCSFVLF